MAKKKPSPIVMRTVTISADKINYRAQLFALVGNVSQIVISKMTAEEIEVKTMSPVTKHGQELVIHPNYEGLKKAEIAERKEKLKVYLEKSTVIEALREVGKEVLPANPDNKDSKETIISWCPKVEKDLGFEIVKQFVPVSTTEEIESITHELEYSFKQVHKIDLLFRVRAKDFMTHSNNIIKNLKK